MNGNKILQIIRKGVENANEVENNQVEDNPQLQMEREHESTFAISGQ